MSQMSPGCYFGAEDQESSVKDLLNAVVTMGKTPDEVRAQVQAIDTADLREAMLADESVVDKLRELEVRIGAVTEVVVTENAPSVCSGAVVTGAGLNNLTGENPKLVIDKPKAEDVLPAGYNNAVAVRFSMELQNVENPEALKVPVVIDIPVPAWINPAFLEIFHYPLDGGEPEIIQPFTYTAGEKTYAQFALTSFSDFVMTMQVPQGSTLILPAGVTQVEDEAFSGSGACIIIVPEGCKSIGSKAFSNCKNLTEIRLPASLETIAADAFEGCQGFSIITESTAVLAMPEFADRIVK